MTTPLPITPSRRKYNILALLFNNIPRCKNNIVEGGQLSSSFLNQIRFESLLHESHFTT